MSKYMLNEGDVAEGGCGVVGFASSKALSGKYIRTAAKQMHNRGNGKGGGVMAIGLSPKEMKVPEEILKSHYLLQIAYLDAGSREKLEEKYLSPFFDIRTSYEIEKGDVNEKPEIEPPLVCRYFVRVKDRVLKEFMKKTGSSDSGKASDEFVYQNIFKINSEFYRDEKKAFVLSHGKDMFVFKIVGYAEQALEYYNLTNVHAHIWLAHQRYPTKGRVWHPGGAHPFIGLNEALVHNGDFANYYAMSEYLTQFGITPLFLTDTEVAALLFDLYDRVFELPLEYAIEALAPTTEHDLACLPKEKIEEYDSIHRSSIHASPDGPWFFIIGRSKPDKGVMDLLSITDTSMLRPQVFAMQKGEHTIGLVASEKQAIDAVLLDLSNEDSSFLPVADKYWNARGGSSSDGGSFVFSIMEKDGKKDIVCRNKFGEIVEIERSEKGLEIPDISRLPFSEKVSSLTGILDKTRSSVTRTRVQKNLNELFDSLSEGKQEGFFHATGSTEDLPESGGNVLVVDASGFPPEGDDSLARFIVEAYPKGYRSFILYNLCGQRFIGCGFGFTDERIRIDVYGSSGDYLGSGISNMELYVHGDCQDQIGQILYSGKLVVFGNVGQTFMYGAKGGEVYVNGNAAGRPLINAVGSPRVVINGTCLDYLAESFMAGDPLNEGGFVILNGIEGNDGKITELKTPYPGGNLFSLASGGAIYLRDPYRKVTEDQLNGGEFARLSDPDWKLILPYLEENEKLFGIGIKDLLTVDGKEKRPEEVYRKIQVKSLEVLK